MKRNYLNKYNEGFTLLETLIYIALLTILMTGILTSVYDLIYLTGRSSQNQEINAALLLKKII